MKMKPLLWGVLFGLIAPFAGIFAGLQISAALGNILAFPVILLMLITESPFGAWGIPTMAFAILLSVVLWALIFGGISMLISQIRKFLA